jgi:hypothetical protein
VAPPASDVQSLTHLERLKWNPAHNKEENILQVEDKSKVQLGRNARERDNMLMRLLKTKEDASPTFDSG